MAPEYHGRQHREHDDDALTSVDQPRPQLGRLAMEQLAELMSGGKARHEVVEPTLVVRSSTTAPR